MTHLNGFVPLTEILFNSLMADIVRYGGQPTTEFWDYVRQEHNKWVRECLKELKAIGQKKPKHK